MDQFDEDFDVNFVFLKSKQRHQERGAGSQGAGAHEGRRDGSQASSVHIYFFVFVAFSDANSQHFNSIIK